MIVADREGVRLQLLAALFVVHLVGDARRRRREPRPPLAVALEFFVRYQLLQKAGALARNGRAAASSPCRRLILQAVTKIRR
jgi:hypothetical protein